MNQPGEEHAPAHGVLVALFEIVVERPVAVTMVFLAAMVFGWVSYKSLPIELLPDVSYPSLTVRTVWDGAAPEELETQVSEPIEEALATLDGLVQIQSRSRAGASDVVLGFDWGTDMSAATQTVRENLQVTFLPEGTERPLLLRYDPSLEPFMRLVLAMDPDHPAAAGDDALYLLRDLAERAVKRDLEGMEGVAAVRVRGGLEREIHVELVPAWMEARKVRVDEVRDALARENVNVAGGSILQGDVEYLVRTLNEYKSAVELENVRVTRADGVTVLLRDIAKITSSHAERTVVAHLDGADAVELEVFKEADANVVGVSRRVADRLGERGKQGSLVDALPAGVVLRTVDDQAIFIEEAIRNVREAALIGGILSILVLYLFLRDAKATLIIGTALPMSVVIGFGPLYLLGVSLNLMSLGGLALGIGMLVDNAVVVLEAIQVYVERGVPRDEAAVKGTAAVAMAVTASTLTAVAVFLPIGLVTGVAGELFGDLSLAVVSSLMASLLVALGFVPMLAALGAKPAKEDATGGLLDAVRALRSRSLRPLWGWVAGEPRAELATIRQRRWYLRPWAVYRLVALTLLRAVAVPALLLLPLGIFALGVLVLSWLSGWSVGWVVAAIAAVVIGWRPAGWLMKQAATLFNLVYEPFAHRYARVLDAALNRPALVLGLTGLALVVSMLIGSRLGTELIPVLHQGRLVVSAQLPVGSPLGRTLSVARRAEQAMRDTPGVVHVHGVIGADRTVDAAADEGENTARFRVELAPGTSEADAAAAIRAAVAKQAPDLQIRVEEPSLFSLDTPIEVIVHADGLDALRQASDRTVAALQAVPALRDVKSSLTDGYPEVRVVYDRERLARLGLDPATLAGRLRDALQGTVATSIREQSQRIDLRVALTEDARRSVQDLANINVNPDLLPPIPLSAVATLDQSVGPSEIRRVDQQRAVVVSAGLSGLDLAGAVEEIRPAMRRAALDPDVTWDIGGQAAELSGSRNSLLLAVSLALFLVYVVMASAFEHLVHPFVILFSVPLAIIGVVAGLWVAGVPLSISVFLGGIVLAGVVVNHAIVLVDAVNQVRREGTTIRQALLTAGPMRLRPILITAATTCLGLVPLALGFGAGIELQQPLAITLIGGVASSTILTLVIIPIVYTVFAGGYRR